MYFLYNIMQKLYYFYFLQFFLTATCLFIFFSVSIFFSGSCCHGSCLLLRYFRPVRSPHFPFRHHAVCLFYGPFPIVGNGSIRAYILRFYFILCAVRFHLKPVFTGRRSRCRLRYHRKAFYNLLLGISGNQIRNPVRISASKRRIRLAIGLSPQSKLPNCKKVSSTLSAPLTPHS